MRLRLPAMVVAAVIFDASGKPLSGGQQLL